MMITKKLLNKSGFDGPGEFDDADVVILPDVNDMAKKLDQQPQEYDLSAFKRHNEKQDEAAEKDAAAGASDPTDPTTSPAYVEAKAIATTLDVGVAFLCCYMIAGNNNFSAYRAEKNALNELVNAWVPVVEKYQWKLGPEVALAAICFGAYMPVVSKAVNDRKAADAKKAKPQHDTPTAKQTTPVEDGTKES